MPPKTIAIDNFPLNKRQLLIVANIFFWFTFITFDSISTAGILNGYLSFTVLRAVLHAIIFAVIMVYPNLYILYPKYFSNGKYLTYAIFALILISITLILRTSLDSLFANLDQAKKILDAISPSLYNEVKAEKAMTNIIEGQFLTENHEFEFSYYLGMIIGCLGVFFITSPIKLVEDWYEKQQLKVQVLEDRLKHNETKLKFLKAQADPHFLINSLSGVYNLALLESDKIDQAILRLSELMSYLLGYGQRDKIALKHEINFIENFIDFHQAINLDELDISFSHNASPNQLEVVEIPPMLLQPFFENALKHGNVEDDAEGWIKSELILEENELIFTIRNSVDPKRARLRKAKSHNVGLQNVRERLEMYFPDGFNLGLKENEGEYRVEMTFPS